MATFVLVHGGFHRGWCWKKVTPLLRAVGHEIYTVTDEEDVRWIKAHMTPHPLRGFTDPVHLRHPDAFAGRRTYIACTGPDGRQPPAVTLSAERVRAEAGWRYLELATGHHAVVTAPQALVALLLEATPLSCGAGAATGGRLT